MPTYNKTLKLIATKLGLAEEEKLLNKAAEYERLLQTKSTPANMTDTSKSVICLDLAAAVFGANLDNKMAVKYSGLKGPSYSSCRKVVENLLELNCDKLTVPLLCVMLHCTGIEALAQEILDEYQKSAKIDVDFNLPHYVCMAVYQACRLNKTKVAKSKIIDKSRLKPAQWGKLDAEWTKIVDKKFATLKNKGKSPKNAEDNAENLKDVCTLSPKEEKSNEPQIEPFEEWKKKILEQAYKQISEIEKKKFEMANEPRKMKEFISPRRSPRKTPQKFSPYKSPKKLTGGVRLLFPIE